MPTTTHQAMITEMRAACQIGDESMEAGRAVRRRAILARLAAASPAPWYRTISDDGLIRILHRVTAGTVNKICTVLRTGRNQHADADLIAHAPADLAWLIIEADRVREERDLLLKTADDATMLAYWQLRAARHQDERTTR